MAASATPSKRPAPSGLELLLHAGAPVVTPVGVGELLLAPVAACVIASSHQLNLPFDYARFAATCLAYARLQNPHTASQRFDAHCLAEALAHPAAVDVVRRLVEGYTQTAPLTIGGATRLDKVLCRREAAPRPPGETPPPEDPAVERRRNAAVHHHVLERVEGALGVALERPWEYVVQDRLPPPPPLVVAMERRRVSSLVMPRRPHPHEADGELEEGAPTPWVQRTVRGATEDQLLGQLRLYPAALRELWFRCMERLGVDSRAALLPPQPFTKFINKLHIGPALAALHACLAAAVAERSIPRAHPSPRRPRPAKTVPEAAAPASGHQASPHQAEIADAGTQTAALPVQVRVVRVEVPPHGPGPYHSHSTHPSHSGRPHALDDAPRAKKTIPPEARRRPRPKSEEPAATEASPQPRGGTFSQAPRKSAPKPSPRPSPPRVQRKAELKEVAPTNTAKKSPVVVKAAQSPAVPHGAPSPKKALPVSSFEAEARRARRHAEGVPVEARPFVAQLGAVLGVAPEPFDAAHAGDHSPLRPSPAPVAAHVAPDTAAVYGGKPRPRPLPPSDKAAAYSKLERQAALLEARLANPAERPAAGLLRPLAAQEPRDVPGGRSDVSVYGLPLRSKARQAPAHPAPPVRAPVDVLELHALAQVLPAVPAARLPPLRQGTLSPRTAPGRGGEAPPLASLLPTKH